MIQRILVLFCLGVFAFSALEAQQPATPAPQTAPATQAPATQAPATQAPATQPEQQPDQSAPAVIHLGVNEVNLIFTVTDKHGHYIPNLQQSDFALLDDQKAPAKINYFRQQINLPLRVGIVIDASTSIRSRFQFEQQSAIEFLLDILKDAVYTACRDKLLDLSRDREPVRKAIVLLSDGDDNQSRVRPDEAIKECERAETIIFAISTNWTPSRGKGDKALQDLSEATGGETFFPPSVEEMSASFKQIEEELRSQYALDYTPADFKTDGSFRTIYLYCNDRRYTARAKKGYFAPRQ